MPIIVTIAAAVAVAAIRMIKHIIINSSNKMK
jgi:hypothetical protein